MDLLEKYRFISQKKHNIRERELGSASTSTSKELQPSNSSDVSNKQCLVAQKASVNGAECDSETPDSKMSSPESAKRPCNGVTFVPETPEDLLKGSGNSDKNGHQDRLDSLSDSEEPVTTSRKAKRKCLLLTDSESDSDDKDSNKTKRAKVTSSSSLNKETTVSNSLTQEISDDEDSLTSDVFTDKEKSLRTLMQTFPKMDLMKVQDTLVKCDWQADKAIHVLQEMCDPVTCDHVPKPLPPPADKKGTELKSSAQPSTNSQQLTIVPEPQRKNSDSEKPDPELNSISNNSHEQHVLSDVETESSINTNDSLQSNDVVNRDAPCGNHSTTEPPCTPDSPDIDDSPIKVVRHRIHQLSSDSDSDSNGSSEGVTIISMEKKPPPPPPPPPTKAVRQSEHDMSSDDKESSRPKSSKPKKSKKKRKKKDVAAASDDEVDYAGDDLYDSDDSDIDDQLTPAREAVLDFYRNGSAVELLTIPGCSKKKVETIINCRPYTGWVDLVKKLQSHRTLSTDMLAGARDVIVTREVMNKLMQKCEKIASDMEKVVSQMNSKNMKGNCIKEQPSILNQNLKLSPYQMIGLNWLWVMHSRQLNGILADEMGLGKTIQAISFLAYLKMTEGKKNSKHLVIVPSSTMDNWIREFHTWCPSMEIITYHGSQEMRRELRLQIINDEIEHFDVMVTTYNMLSSSPEDRTLFRRLAFHYVVFDEAHMLKNMNTQRYQNLMKIKADRRLLLTGTPLQNNLVELMSLLIFVMPNMFYNKVDQVKQMFASACKSEENRSDYEKNRIDHAKRIMKPFVLRRLKKEVLKELPTKHEELLHCLFTPYQKDLYMELVKTFSEKINNEKQDASKQSGVVMMMELRKAANHPLLLRKKYTDQKLREMSKKLLNEPTYMDASSDLIFEDMQVMSDFELHRLCKNFKSISTYKLSKEDILDSGKFVALDKILPEMKEQGSRFLLFSQFTMMLDIVEEYMAIRNYSYFRLDGTTPVTERQELMDRFNGNADVFAFLLSTKAGGLGINLTAANVVLLHDIDFNPYNDKQAEDRCHRLGQTREVTVKKMIMKNSIEEAILQCAMDKLKLERDITTDNDKDNEEDLKTVGNVLKTALAL